MKTLFGNPELIKKNKRMACLAELEDDPAEKEYEIKVEYTVTETKSYDEIKVIKVHAQTAEEAIELAEAQVHNALDTDEDIDVIDSTVLQTNQETYDEKTINMFNAK